MTLRLRLKSQYRLIKSQILPYAYKAQPRFILVGFDDPYLWVALPEGSMKELDHVLRG